MLEITKNGIQGPRLASSSVFGFSGFFLATLDEY